ncbi:MAG: extracellular solute-binding protein [Nocardioidaceae bacterium]|nr:extracellular solute-binding protein [Nocardioidaceae bacterium]
MPSRYPSLTRRGFLGLTAAAGATGLFSGCSSLSSRVLASKPPVGTTTFWNLWAGGDGDRAAVMYDKYRSEHGASSLEAITFAWGNPYYTKLSLETLGERPPDIAVAHVTRLPSLQRAGLVEKIDDATLAAGGLAAEDFSEPAWTTALVGGEAYCLPYDIGPIVLFYNTDICEKAGLLDDQGVLKPLQGEEAFTAALEAGQRAGADHGAGWAVINDPGMNWRAFNSLYTQKKVRHSSATLPRQVARDPPEHYESAALDGASTLQQSDTLCCRSFGARRFSWWCCRSWRR